MCRPRPNITESQWMYVNMKDQQQSPAPFCFGTMSLSEHACIPIRKWIANERFFFSGVYEHIKNKQSISNTYPYFDTTSERNVTSIVNQATHLHCTVKDIGDRTVRIWCGVTYLLIGIFWCWRRKSKIDRNMKVFLSLRVSTSCLWFYLVHFCKVCRRKVTSFQTKMASHQESCLRAEKSSAVYSLFSQKISRGT